MTQKRLGKTALKNPLQYFTILKCIHSKMSSYNRAPTARKYTITIYKHSLLVHRLIFSIDRIDINDYILISKSSLIQSIRFNKIKILLRK